MIKEIVCLSFASFLFLGTGAKALPTNLIHHVHKAKEAVTTLKIYNSNDYIYKEENGDGVIEEFKEYVKETDGVTLDITYDVFDTNEIMLSQLETGSASYDLVCPSDYMIQKMMSKGMVIPFASGEDRKALYGDRYEGWEDNYSHYASPYLQDAFKNISATLPDGSSATLDQYARGYMWGTLGIIYNPDFYRFVEQIDENGNPVLSADDVKVQMNDWNVLWNKNYKGTFQIKDSMRDTYAVGLMKCYDDLFQKILTKFENKEIDDTEYNKEISTIFNNISHIDDFNALDKKYGGAGDATADSIISSIESALSSLRANSYGLEVDSGKSDILDGKLSGIGIAWSGDAVYSIDTAETLGTNLYYSIPKTGGNIWFDGWVLLKNCKNQEYAQKFIDFISNPEIAAQNMDYIGYTPFIAGDDILELVRSWYDPRFNYMYAYDETANDYYYDDDGEPYFKNGTGVINKDVEGEPHTIDFGDVNMEGSDFSTPVINGETSSWEEIAAENEWTKVDLTYFFDGSFKEGSEYFDGVDGIFYSDSYESITGKNLSGETETVMVGRGFFAQYPPKELLPKLCVMEDYGDNNAFVLKMWESVKSGNVPLWVTIVLSIEVAFIVTALCLYSGYKIANKKLRKNRRLERKTN